MPICAGSFLHHTICAKGASRAGSPSKRICRNSRSAPGARVISGMHPGCAHPRPTPAATTRPWSARLPRLGGQRRQPRTIPSLPLHYPVAISQLSSLNRSTYQTAAMPATPAQFQPDTYNVQRPRTPPRLSRRRYGNGKENTELRTENSLNSLLSRAQKSRPNGEANFWRFGRPATQNRDTPTPEAHPDQPKNGTMGNAADRLPQAPTL